MNSTQQVMTSLQFFQFMVNLVGSQNLDPLSVKLTFSLTVSFDHTKTENSLILLV